MIKESMIDTCPYAIDTATMAFSARLRETVVPFVDGQITVLSWYFIPESHARSHHFRNRMFSIASTKLHALVKDKRNQFSQKCVKVGPSTPFGRLIHDCNDLPSGTTDFAELPAFDSYLKRVARCVNSKRRDTIEIERDDSLCAFVEASVIKF